MIAARALLAVALGIPTAAFAHGEDAVVTFLAQLVALAMACLISFLSLRRFRRTWIGVAASFAGVIVSWAVTWELPYDANEKLIATLSIGLPLLGGAAASWIVRELMERKIGT